MWNIDTILTYLNIDLSRLRDVFLYDPQAPMIFSSAFAKAHYRPFAVCHPVFLLFLLQEQRHVLLSAGVGYSQRFPDSSLYGADDCEVEA